MFVCWLIILFYTSPNFKIHKIYQSPSALYSIHVLFTQLLNCYHLNAQIYDQGYSRIPVYEGTRDNVIGLLLVKILIRTDICEKKTIRSLVSSLLTPRFCLKVTPLYTALNQFFIVKSEFRIYTGGGRGARAPQL